MQLNFEIIKTERATRKEFITYWSGQYVDKNPALYEMNIGKSLTKRRILELFEWKNGGEISTRKQGSIHRNYITTKPTAPRIGDNKKLVEFINKPGGAIWRIFWLHCYDPETYPIFDQHVYRAMKHLQGKPAEIPNKNREKARLYVEEYLPFHAGFRSKNKRTLDKALWTYGKYLKGRNAL